MIQWIDDAPGTLGATDTQKSGNNWLLPLFLVGVVGAWTIWFISTTPAKSKS